MDAEKRNVWCVHIQDNHLSSLEIVGKAVGKEVKVWMPMYEAEGKKEYLYPSYCFLISTEEEAKEFEKINNVTNKKKITVLTKMDGKKLKPLREDEIAQIKRNEETYRPSDKRKFDIGDTVMITSGLFGGTKGTILKIADFSILVEFESMGREQTLWLDIDELERA